MEAILVIGNLILGLLAGRYLFPKSRPGEHAGRVLGAPLAEVRDLLRQRLPEGWKVIGIKVDLIEDPAGGRPKTAPGVLLRRDSSWPAGLWCVRFPDAAPGQVIESDSLGGALSIAQAWPTPSKEFQEMWDKAGAS